MKNLSTQNLLSRLESLSKENSAIQDSLVYSMQKNEELLIDGIEDSNLISDLEKIQNIKSRLSIVNFLQEQLLDNDDECLDFV